MENKENVHTALDIGSFGHSVGIVKIGSTTEPTRALNCATHTRTHPTPPNSTRSKNPGCGAGDLLGEFAFRSFEAEPREVVRAGVAFGVAAAAARAVLAEPLGVPGAFLLQFLRALVQEHAVGIAADPVVDIEMTQRHLSKVQDVQELAIVALLAKASPPVFADDRLGVGHAMPQGTGIAAVALALLECSGGRGGMKTFCQQKIVNGCRNHGWRQSIGREGTQWTTAKTKTRKENK